MFFNPTQTAELLSIMDKFNLTYIARAVGYDFLTQEEIDFLISYGFDISLLGPNDSYITQAFKFGLLTTALGDDKTRFMSYDQFKEYLKSGQFVELSPLQESMVTSLKIQTAQDITRSTAGMKTDLTRALYHIEQGKSIKHNKDITGAAIEVINKRGGVNELKSILGHQQGTWSKQWDRIGDYVLHQAFNEARVSQFEQDDLYIFFDVFPGACHHCSDNYLTAGLSSPPILWKADVLKSNGSNVGVKAKEWKATIGPMHPWCRCTATAAHSAITRLDLLPYYGTGGWQINPDSIWSWDGSQYIPKGPLQNRKVQRTSKVKITVDGKTTTI